MNVNIEGRSHIHCCPGKVTSITYYLSESLVIQHSKRVRRIMLSSVAILALQYFSALTRKRYDLWEKGGFNIKIRVFIFSTTFV